MKKVSLIIVGLACLAGCTAHPQTLVSQADEDIKEKSHLVWCHTKPSDCLEQAGFFCADLDSNIQRAKPGKFHLVKEPGMSFPAILKDADHGWSMRIVCDANSTE